MVTFLPFYSLVYRLGFTIPEIEMRIIGLTTGRAAIRHPGALKRAAKPANGRRASRTLGGATQRLA